MEHSELWLIGVVDENEPRVYLPSPEEVELKKTPRGAWTRKQLAEWGVDWPPKAGWRRKLRERYEAFTANANR